MDQPLNNPNEDQNQFYSSGQNNIYDNQGQPPIEEIPPTKPGYYPPPQDVPQNQDYPSPQDLNVLVLSEKPIKILSFLFFIRLKSI